MSVAILRMRRAVASPVKSLMESVFQMSRTAHLDQLRNVYRGMSAGDVEMAVAAFAPDVHYDESVLHWDLHGRDQVKEHLVPWLTYADPKIEVLDGFEVDDRAVAKWQASGTVTAELPGIWTGEAVGKEFSFTGVTLARFDENGLIREDVEVWNLAALFQQLGLLPS